MRTSHDVTMGDRAGGPAVPALRLMFGLVWAVDATLKWQPGFRRGFAAMLDATAQGQPGWLKPWFDVWTGLGRHDGTLLAYGAAVTETALAVGLLLGLARRMVYAAGVGYTFVLWGVAEGFGGPYHSGSTDVGAAVIYAFVFAALLILDRRGGHGLDALIERRWEPWAVCAEPGEPLRRPAVLARKAEVLPLPLPPLVASWPDDWPA